MKFEKDKLRSIMARNNLRQQDLAWMCGVNVRQARAWCNGEFAVPQYAGLLIMAYDEGLLEPSWFARKIRAGVLKKKDATNAD